ncbi:hypothetical protein CYMTET_51863 [Cymbomonas tetramitiformis]|uniref:Uncharacterized protein n=1 Tax=Cymbomonas tetramitiformis TaxID=36881 RepID=A0AAE0BLV6_9CHLO|nr:hypothetical protein CYMTET_51863 [Cymbomonas tetramitiformis]
MEDTVLHQFHWGNNPAKQARKKRREKRGPSLKRKTEATQAGSSKKRKKGLHKEWCRTDVNSMNKKHLDAFLECAADEIPEESWTASNPDDRDTSTSAIQHDIACKVIADYIFQGDITHEDVRGLLERKNRDVPNSHFKRTDVHERLLIENTQYYQQHAMLVQRLKILFKAPYLEDEDVPTPASKAFIPEENPCFEVRVEIPTEAGEEESTKPNAVPTYAVPSPSPDEQVLASGACSLEETEWPICDTEDDNEQGPSEGGASWNIREVEEIVLERLKYPERLEEKRVMKYSERELQDVQQFFKEAKMHTCRNKSTSVDPLAYFNMPSSDCDEVYLGSDKAFFDRSSNAQSSFGMKYPYCVACFETYFAFLQL